MRGADLDGLVPAARHDERARGGRGEADAADPLSVALLATTDGVLAVACIGGGG